MHDSADRSPGLTVALPGVGRNAAAGACRESASSRRAGGKSTVGRASTRGWILQQL